MDRPWFRKWRSGTLPARLQGWIGTGAFLVIGISNQVWTAPLLAKIGLSFGFADKISEAVTWMLVIGFVALWFAKSDFQLRGKNDHTPTS
jgi:hypothetical protein